MDWEYLFQPQIIDRGYDYYQRGLVTDFTRTSKVVTATVLGTEVYSVTLRFSGDSLTDADCTCPYATDGNYCKHEAAVLFYADHGGQGSPAEAQSKNTPTLTALVRDASDQQVRDFLTRVLTADGRLAQQFKMLVAPESHDGDLKLYQAQINDIFQVHMDRQHFIDYDEATDFGQELEDFLLTDVQAMILANQFELAFKVVNNLALKLGRVDIDDSDGEVMTLVDLCQETWEKLLKRADLPLQRQMFAWFKKHANGASDAFEDTLITILMNNFTEPEFAKKKLTWIDQQLKRARQLSDEWEREYIGGNWAMNRLKIMNELQASSADIDAFAQSNLDFTDVRKFMANRYRQRQDYARAIDLLKAGKQQGKNQHLSGIVSGFSRQLKDVYREAGQSEAYRQELWDLLTGSNAADLDLYQELKGLVDPTKWPAERERLFKSVPKFTDLKPLYAADELYPQLLNAVLATPNLSAVETYEDVLKPLYPRQLLGKYIKTAKEMAQRTGTRKHYRQIVAVLNQMVAYRGGLSAATDLIETWRQTYPRRPAMLEELRRFDGSPS